MESTKNQNTPNRQDSSSTNNLKRKREAEDPNKDAKLNEFLSVMQHSSKTRTWANDDDGLVQPLAADQAANNTDKIEETAEKIPENPVKKPKVKAAIVSHSATQEQTRASEDAENDDVDAQDDSAPIDGQEDQPKSDADWLRSKTSRLLGLLDEEEQAEVKAPSSASEDDSDKPAKSKIIQQQPEDIFESQASPEEEEIEEERDYDADVELIRTSGRLFLRNLAYGATETDLEPIFAPFGKIDEVSY
jgi:multiple RNA-binding domain-containing protein 1